LSQIMSLTSADQQEFLSVLRTAITEMDLNISELAIQSMARHYRLMVEVNQELNLTAITSPREAAIKHYADSLALLKILPPSGKAIDVGSGAGFPGLPLAIANSQWEWTLVESRQKKAEFIEDAAQQLNLTSVKVSSLRSEELGLDPAARDQFDLAVGRAVASLGAIVELLAPFVRTGGMVVAMKGPEEDASTNNTEALQRLGLGSPECIEYDLPFDAGRRKLMIFRKVAATPPEFPRRPGRAAKRPLFL